MLPFAEIRICLCNILSHVLSWGFEDGEGGVGNEFGGGGIGGFVAGRGYMAGLGCRVVIYGSLAVT